MAEILDVAPLYFTCPCGTKQSAGLTCSADFHTAKAEKGTAEEHTCKACGVRARYGWDEFTFDADGAAVFVDAMPEEGGDDGR